MSGLTDAERDALHAPHAVPINPTWWSGCPICHDYLAAVEAIVARAVKEALEDAAELIGQFDPTDKYHSSAYELPGYYSALSRAEALLLGHISDWRDQGPAGRAT